MIEVLLNVISVEPHDITNFVVYKKHLGVFAPQREIIILLWRPDLKSSSVGSDLPNCEVIKPHDKEKKTPHFVSS